MIHFFEHPPRWLWFIVAPFVFAFGIAHESIHYVFARVLGLEAEWHWDYVLVENAPNWKTLIHKLAPAVIGLIVTLAFVHMMQRIFVAPLAMAFVVWFGFGWQLGCGSDFYDVWFFWRYGQWHRVESV